jgi:hypothetical protein
VVLYRPEPGSPPRHRLLELDRRGTVVAVCEREAGGALRGLWLPAEGAGALGVRPGGATHPLWGASDRLVRAAEGGADRLLTCAAVVDWAAIDAIPPVAEPARLPPGAGSGVLNALAGLAQDQARGPLRYRGPYPTEQLFWALCEAFRPAAAPDPLGQFLADAEETFATGQSREAPLDWVPAPHERLALPGGGSVQLRDGVEKVAWAGRTYHRTDWPGFRRREHRVVRAIEDDGGAVRYEVALEALGRVLERHLVLDARGDPVERPGPQPEDGPARPVASAWRETLGRLAPLEATPLLAVAIDAVWPAFHVAWGPVPGDLVEARDTSVRLSWKLVAAYRALHAAAPPAARRALAQALVREVLGLTGPAVRAAAGAWLEGLSPGRRAAALDAGRRDDRRARAAAASGGLRRLVDALEAGAALPA